jgi:hypothetical protein
MTRLHADCLTVTSSKDRLTVTSSRNCFAVTSPNDCLSITKSLLALLVCFSLLTTPVWSAPNPSSSLGIVVFADRAHLGAAQASVGATVFSGDRLTTEQSGSIQVRAGAARLLLSSGSMATFSQDDATPSATLTVGTATFSTASSNAFVLHMGSAVIRPASNKPTVGRVTVLGSKELIVRSTRGSLTISVDDDVREIPEGGAYRVVLDPNAEPQGPQGAGSKGYGGPPIKAAKSKFIWYAIAITAVVTYFAVSEALESPERP